MSADGELIAYDVWPLPHDSPIRSYVLDRATGQVTPLVAEDGHEVFTPEWSPSGRFVLAGHAIPNYVPTATIPPLAGSGPTARGVLIDWRGVPEPIDLDAGVGRSLVLDTTPTSDAVTFESSEHWGYEQVFWVE